MKKLILSLTIVTIPTLLIIGYLINEILSDINMVQIKNDKPYNELITVLYDYDELKEFEKEIRSNYYNIDANYIHSKFKVEVLRKTCYGYYIILKAKNDYKLFIFMNDEKEIWAWYLIDEFKSEKEFLSKIKINETTIDEIEEYDKSGFGFTSAGRDMYYTTKEGYIWLLHELDEVGTIKEVFTEKNDDYLDEDTKCPLLLPIDKQ